MLTKKTRKLLLSFALSGVLVFSYPVFSDALHNKRTDIYLRSLSMLKDYAEIRRVLQKEIDSADGSDLPRLMRLAQYGSDNNMKTLAATAYEKVLTADPENLTAKRNMAEILYDEKKYEAALKFLRDYNAKTGGDYVTNYNQAEIMHLLRTKLGSEKADPFFEKALEQASLMGGGAREAEMIRAKSLFRLGKPKEAFAVFEELEKMNPGDIFVTVDYARMLYDVGLLDEAYAQLKKLPEDIFDEKALAIYKLDKQQTDDIILTVASIRIAYEQANRHFFTVKKMIKELESHYPDKYEVFLAKASYYSSYENWRGELESDMQALKLQPEDGTLVKEVDRLSRLHGSYIQNEFGVRLSDNDGVELMNQSKLELRITDDLRLGVNYTVDNASLHDVPRMDGTTKGFRGVRTIAEVFLQGDFINGDSARLSFFDQDGVAGLGGWYKLLDYWGNTTVKGAWREPYWLEQQAVAEKGSKTYIQLGREFKPFESLTLSADTAFNSYNLKEHENLTKSVAIGAKAEYKLPRIELQKKWLGEQSVFSVNYEYDYENFFDHKENSDGTRKYNPQDIQVHSFYLAYTNQFTDDLSATLSAGYAYDVAGGAAGSGLIYGASVSYFLTKKLEITANVNQTTSTNRYFYAGLSLKYYFMPETLAELIMGDKRER